MLETFFRKKRMDNSTLNQRHAPADEQMFIKAYDLVSFYRQQYPLR